MRESWTDERLDDFATHVDRRLDAVDRRFDQMEARFDRMDARFDKMDDRFDGLNARFDAMQRAIFQSSVLVIAALIGLIATQL